MDKAIASTLADGAAATGSLVTAVLPYALNLIGAIAILIAGFLIARVLSRILGERLERIEGFDSTLIPVMSQIVRYGVLIVTFVLVLGQFGVQTASIIAVLGAAGLAIGLALQGTLQNVAAGIMLLVLRPFRIGDYIEAAGTSGTVREIGLFATRLNTAQNLFVSLPNSKVFGDAIVNYSFNDTRRSDIGIGISYDADIEQARQIILGVIAKENRANQLPAPVITLRDLGESSVDLEARVWFARKDFRDGTSALRQAIKIALDDAGIEIPYPHRQIIVSDAGKSAPQIGAKRKTPARKRAS